MNRKLFFICCLLVTLGIFISSGFHNTSAETLPSKSPLVSLLPSLTFPRETLTITSSKGLPGATRITTDGFTPIRPGTFSWIDWWNVNLSYLMDMRDEALFYKQVAVKADDVTKILSLMDYSGVFFPVTRKVAEQCLEKLDDDGISRLAAIASGQYQDRANVHPSISQKKMQGLACYCLGVIRATDHIAVVEEATKITQPDVRMLAVLGLGKMATETAEDFLLKMLENETDGRVTAAILISLAQIGSEKGRKALLEAADSYKNNPTKQAFAYIALSLLMNKPSVADINRASFSADPPLWLSGAIAKASLISITADATKRSVDELIEQLISTRLEGVSDITAILPLYLIRDKLARADISKLLKHPNQEVRALTRFLAAFSNVPELTSAVVSKIEDDTPDTVYLQSLALAYLAAPDRQKYARELLKEKSKIAKIAGILALGNYMAKLDIPKIKALSTDYDMDLAVMLSLSRAVPEVSNAWIELAKDLKSKKRMVQDISMVLIGTTNTKRSAKLLLEFKDSGVDELPYSIAISLLGPLPYELTLRNALEAKSDVARASAVLAFSFLPLESTRALLFEQLESDTIPLSRAHAAVGLMMSSSSTITDRQAEILIEASEKGADEWVKGYATLALGKYASNRDVAILLEKQLDSQDYQLRAMSALSAGINKYPRGVQLLKKLIETESSDAIMAQITALGMFKHRMFVPYFASGIKASASDPQRLAFAAALSSSIDPTDYEEIIEKMKKASSVDKKTYAWTLALHDYPGEKLAGKVIDALKTQDPGNDQITRFHIALARCALGDGEGARELLDTASFKGFAYTPIVPQPKFLLEYLQEQLPEYNRVVPYFFFDEPVVE